MPHTTGTATDYIDLLDRLRLYAVANGWTQLSWTAGTVSGGGSLLQLEGPGAGVGRRVYLNFRTTANTTNSLYSWNIRGATGYTVGAVAGANPGEQQTPVWLNLWQNTIQYWFYINDRRIIVVAKCSTAYMSFYGGFFLPFSVPTQYPFPLLVAADYGSSVIWSHTNSGRRMMVDPGGNMSAPAAWTRSPSGQWVSTYNQDLGAGNDEASDQQAGAVVRMWPYHVGEANSSALAYDDWTGSVQPHSGGAALDSFIATRQGERWLWPVTLIPSNEPIYGTLDGVWCVPGTGLATEQVVTVGADTYRVFQNIQRSSGNDFFAVRQV